MEAKSRLRFGAQGQDGLASPMLGNVPLPGALAEREGAQGCKASIASGHMLRHERDDHKGETSIQGYQRAGVGYGLALALARQDEEVALRVFLLDNSGSTAEKDGHVVTQTGGHYKSVPSTRWEEIRSMAIDQARWNSDLGVRSEFILVNPPCPEQPMEGRSYFVIDPARGHGEAQVAALTTFLNAISPNGPTPLVPRLRELRKRLATELPPGRRVMLSIVTDGLPNCAFSTRVSQLKESEALVEQLREFADAFNSFIVIRLATDDEKVVNFYNKIDEEVELPLDILDDLQGEATEVYDAGNGWLTYTPLIHRIREGGTMEKLFDLLDERPFKTPEIATFLEFILRRSGEPPFPRDPKALWELVAPAVERSPRVYDGRTHTMALPVDLKLLKKALTTKSGRAGCSLM